MTINCVAIDDDKLSIAVITKFCSKVPNLNLNASFTNSVEGFSHLKNNSVDLVFLDINMPNMSGISIAQEINNAIAIVFVTSHKNYAYEGYQLNAIDYLLKPLEFSRFFQAVCKAKDKIQIDKVKYQSFCIDDEYIIINCDYKKIRIAQSQIQYIEALDNYVKIYTTRKTYITQHNLKSMCAMLNNSCFFRVHKSFMVNLPVVDYFTSETIHINGYAIPLGRTYAKEFLKRLHH
jgi:DNA-binding LytR/AlgR family response regulator